MSTAARRDGEAVEVPESTGYVAVDRDGRPLVEGGCLAEVLRAARGNHDAVVVLGAPTGILLASITHGAPTPKGANVLAARRWLRRGRG